MACWFGHGVSCLELCVTHTRTSLRTCRLNSDFTLVLLTCCTTLTPIVRTLEQPARLFLLIEEKPHQKLIRFHVLVVFVGPILVLVEGWPRPPCFGGRENFCVYETPVPAVQFS